MYINKDISTTNDKLRISAKFPIVVKTYEDNKPVTNNTSINLFYEINSDYDINNITKKLSKLKKLRQLYDTLCIMGTKTIKLNEFNIYLNSLSSRIGITGVVGITEFDFKTLKLGNPTNLNQVIYLSSGESENSHRDIQNIFSKSSQTFTLKSIRDQSLYTHNFNLLIVGEAIIPYVYYINFIDKKEKIILSYDNVLYNEIGFKNALDLEASFITNYNDQYNRLRMSVKDPLVSIRSINGIVKIDTNVSLRSLNIASIYDEKTLLSELLRYYTNEPKLLVGNMTKTP